MKVCFQVSEAGLVGISFVAGLVPFLFLFLYKRWRVSKAAVKAPELTDCSTARDQLVVARDQLVVAGKIPVDLPEACPTLPAAVKGELGSGDGATPVRVDIPRSALESKMLSRDISAAKPWRSPRRQRDLAFYRELIGKQLPSSKVARTMMQKAGFGIEAQFLASLHETRCELAKKFRGLMDDHFQKDPRLPLSRKRYTSVDGLPSPKNFATVLRHVPLPVFSAVEEEILLKTGDALFPEYAQRIKTMTEAVNAIITKVPLRRIYNLYHKALWEIDPFVGLSMHTYPPRPSQWLKKGVLSLVPKRFLGKNLKKKDMAEMICEIKIAYTEDHRKGGVSQNFEKYVFTSSTYSQGMNTQLRSTSSNLNSSGSTGDIIEAMDLIDAKVSPLEGNPQGFVIKGRSITKRKLKQRTFLAADERERDDWIVCLSKFRSKKENALEHAAIIMRAFFGILKAFNSPTFEGLETAVDEIASLSFDGVAQTNTEAFRSTLERGIDRAFLKASAIAGVGWPAEHNMYIGNWMLQLIDNSRCFLETVNASFNDDSYTLNPAGEAIAVKRGNGQCCIS